MTKASTFAKKSFRFRSNFKFETTQNRTHTIARFAPVYSVSVQTLKRLFSEHRSWRYAKWWPSNGDRHLCLSKDIQDAIFWENDRSVAVDRLFLVDRWS